ncbi:MAG: T9SS type A sorting domain-containing protein [Bacteroidota bacterium]|nr:T9SS type A sorting domain-containing protein [Bacteroidota bacterium]MDX5504720.1 T9SS type A sorting domain-containing protein [Bacteroidota bacterium]
MRRGLLGLVLTVFAFVSAWAQPIDTLYEERFEVTPYQIVTGNTSGNAYTWHDTTFARVPGGGTKSLHAQIRPQDSIFFETSSFDCTGKFFVRLSFAHICKIQALQSGFVQISTNNGATWTTLDSASYKAASPLYPSVEYFNELSYPNAPGIIGHWDGPTFSGTGTNPTNSWWKDELFDLTPWAANQSNVKLRFFHYQYSNPAPLLAGWFVDNILVEGAPCELEPPTIRFNNPTVANNPQGNRYALNQTVQVWVKDIGDGVKDSTILWYRSPRLTSGNWVSTTMNRLGGSTGCDPNNDNIDSILFSHTFANLQVGDSVDYYVEAYDCACPNMDRKPNVNNIPNYYSFKIDPSPPLICGNTTVTTFPFIVSSFPYLETFDGNEWGAGTGTGDASTGNGFRGTFPIGNPPAGKNWQVSPSPTVAAYAWSVRQGATNTLQTGPSQDNTPGPGGKYLYTEASQTVGTTTDLITHCLDLRLQPCMGLEFYYHMYGQNIGTLTIDVDTGDATPAWVTNYWSISGQRQQSSSAPWTAAFVSLEPFSGKYIRLRFRGTKGGGDKGDLAIDDIRVFEPDPIDVALLSTTRPQNGFCGYSSQEEVNLIVQSKGCQTLTQIPIAYSITDLNTSVTTTFRDTIQKTFATGDTTFHIFAPRANLSAYTDYRIVIWNETPGDVNSSNDTLGPITINHDPPITNFPMIFDADAPGYVSGSPNGPGTRPATPGWIFFPTPGSTNFSWWIADEWTPTNSTGPLEDWSGTKGNFYVVEGTNGAVIDNAGIQSECMSFAGMNAPVLDFWYHMYGVDAASIIVQYVPNGTNSWKLVPNGFVFNTGGNGQTSEKDDWKFKRVDLGFLADSVVKLRIITQKNGTGDRADIALDNIHIYDRGTADVGITRVGPPPLILQSTDALGNPVSTPLPAVRIYNYGTQAVSNVPVSITITPDCNGTPYTFTQTYNGTIQPNSEATFAFTSMPQPWPSGGFTICATTTLSGDNTPFNNERCKQVTGWPRINVPFFANFDNCSGEEWGFYGTNGKLRLFEVGAPSSGQFGGNAASSPNVWGSGLSRNYQASTEEILNFPIFFGFDTIWAPSLRFNHRFSFGAGDAGLIEYLVGANWQRLGIPGLGTNVYNTSTVNVLGGEPGFTGNSAGWEYTEIPLNFLNEASTPLVIRARMKSAGSQGQGWAFDNIELHIPPQNSASPVDIDVVGTSIPLFIPYVDNEIQVTIRNTGAKPLDTVQIHYRVYDNSGNLVFGPTNKEPVQIKPRITQGRSIRYNLLQPWTNPSPGKYTLCMITSRPNDKTDNFPQDDSVCFNVSVLDEVDLAAGGYCNDFDDPSQIEWVTYNYADKNGITNWEKGTPVQLTPLAGSPTSWMTGLNNNYKNRDSSALFTPVFLIEDSTIYKIKFKHQFKTELYHDGGSIDISFDGGRKWRTVGRYFRDPTIKWFNTEYVTSLNFIQPGWTGESNGWIDAELNVQFDTTAGGIFRFRFGADETFEFSGWAIDSFCIDTTSEPADIYLDVEELENFGSVAGNLFPNPSVGLTNLPIVTKDFETAEISIHNMIGQHMASLPYDLEPGENIVQFDVTGWTPGVYLVTIDIGGRQIIKKLVVGQR